MKRLKLRKQTKIKKSTILIFTILLMMLSIICVFSVINKKVSKVIVNYAHMEAKKLSSIIINKAISKHITEKISPDDLFTITKDDNGEIKAIDFNSDVVNKFLTETTNSIQINLKNIEEGDIDALEFSDSILVEYNEEKLRKGIIYEVGTGVIWNNPLLSNVGPKIPVKINLLGDATSSVSSEVKNYGINNALIEVYVNVSINIKVILPFFADTIKVDSKVPVAIKLVTGVVPKYYANGINQSTPPLVVDNE